jgi:hypothetical protein
MGGSAFIMLGVIFLGCRDVSGIGIGISRDLKLIDTDRS